MPGQGLRGRPIVTEGMTRGACLAAALGARAAR